MKGLTRADTQKWLDLSGISISDDLNLVFPENPKGNRHTAQKAIPKDDVNLWRFAEAIVGWLPHNSGERIVWFKWWDTYPLGQIKFLERVRHGCGEMRSLFETPGHLFKTTAYSDYESRTSTDEDEEAIIAGLILLALSLESDVFYVAKDCKDYVFISDGFVLFSSEDPKRIELAPIHGRTQLP